MKKIWFGCLLISSSLFAALPPLAQSTREMQALLADSHLQDWLGSAEMLQEIVRADGGFVVVTQNYSMKVDVHYLPAKRIGPAQFQFEFQKPVHLRTGEVKQVEDRAAI